MVNTLRNKYEGFISAEIKMDNAVYKALGHLGNPTVGYFIKWYIPTISKTVQLLLKT